MVESRTYDATGRQAEVSSRNRAGTLLTRFAYTYVNPATGADTSLRQAVT